MAMNVCIMRSRRRRRKKVPSRKFNHPVQMTSPGGVSDAPPPPAPARQSPPRHPRPSSGATSWASTPQRADEEAGEVLLTKCVHQSFSAVRVQALVPFHMLKNYQVTKQISSPHPPPPARCLLICVVPHAKVREPRYYNTTYGTICELLPPPPLPNSSRRVRNPSYLSYTT